MSLIQKIKHIHDQDVKITSNQRQLGAYSTTNHAEVCADAMAQYEQALKDAVVLQQVILKLQTELMQGLAYEDELVRATTDTEFVSVFIRRYSAQVEMLFGTLGSLKKNATTSDFKDKSIAEQLLKNMLTLDNWVLLSIALECPFILKYIDFRKASSVVQVKMAMLAYSDLRSSSMTDPEQAAKFNECRTLLMGIAFNQLLRNCLWSALRHNELVLLDATLYFLNTEGLAGKAFQASAQVNTFKTVLKLNNSKLSY